MNRLSIARALTVLALVFSGAAAFAQAPAALAISSTMPKSPAKMMGTDGKEHTLDSVRGAKGTLVVFTCNHCPYVKAWEKRIAEIGNTYKDKGIGVVAINSNNPATHPDDSLDAMKTRAKELGLKFPYVVDQGSAVARAFRAQRTPEVFLFDASGKLVYHGAVDDNAEKPAEVTKHFLKDALEAVLAGKHIATAETRSVGCSIKFYPEAATP
jgi:peroxiredoxin